MRVGQVGEDLVHVRLVENEVSLFLWLYEQESHRTRRHPRDDPRAEVGEDVRVGVCVGVRVGAVECQLLKLIRCIVRRF